MAAAVTVATMTPMLVPYRQPWWVLVLAVLASVPVLWRRVAFLPVVLVVGGATTVLVLKQDTLAHLPVFFLPFGSLVCTYTLAALPSIAWRRVGVVLLAAGVVYSLVVPHESLDTFRTVTTEFVAAYAIGVGARARRAQRAAEDERSRRLAEARATAVERERTRIARDMHDIVTHSVGLMVVQAEAGPLVVRTDPAKAESAFDAIAETGREAVGQLRRILGTLRGTTDPGVAMPGIGALPGLIERAGKAGLNAALEEIGDRRPVPADVDVAAYRIVQESLTNTLRHSGAGAGRAVRVRLAWTAGRLTVRVADDGGGVVRLREGHGILGMRERAADCGGSLDIDPSGFTVTATLPIGS